MAEPGVHDRKGLKFRSSIKHFLESRRRRFKFVTQLRNQRKIRACRVVPEEAFALDEHDCILIHHSPLHISEAEARPTESSHHRSLVLGADAPTCTRQSTRARGRQKNSLQNPLGPGVLAMSPFTNYTSSDSKLQGAIQQPLRCSFAPCPGTKPSSQSEGKGRENFFSLTRQDQSLVRSRCVNLSHGGR